MGALCCWRMEISSFCVPSKSLISGETDNDVCSLLNLPSLDLFFCLLIKVTRFE